MHGCSESSSPNCWRSGLGPLSLCSVTMGHNDLEMTFIEKKTANQIPQGVEITCWPCSRSFFARQARRHLRPKSSFLFPDLTLCHLISPMILAHCCCVSGKTLSKAVSHSSTSSGSSIANLCSANSSRQTRTATLSCTCSEQELMYTFRAYARLCQHMLFRMDRVKQRREMASRENMLSKPIKLAWPYLQMDRFALGQSLVHQFQCLPGVVSFNCVPYWEILTVFKHLVVHYEVPGDRLAGGMWVGK